MAKTTTTSASNQKTMFDKFELWAEKNNKKLFYGFMLLTCVFVFLLFNVRFSEANDDSGYIETAYKYVNEFPNFYYTFNAPLYPIFLAIVYKFLGFNIITFKLVTALCYVLSVLFFWKALNRKIPHIVFMPVMLFVSINHVMMYYASMTFSEAFYLMIQSILFYLVSNFITKKYDLEFKAQIKDWLLLGLVAMLITISRNVAIVVLPAFILFFGIHKDWKKVGIVTAFFIGFRALYELIVRAFWGNINQFSSQTSAYLRKDYYDASKGTEDVSGFIDRFIGNCDLYLSKRFFQIIGLRDENNLQVYSLLAYIVLAVLIIGTWQFLKQKNKTLLFIAIYTMGVILASLIILHIRWDQTRLILVCVPVMLIIMYHLLYQYVQKSSMGQLIYVVLVSIISISIFLSSFKRVSSNLPTLKKNLAGNIYAGYTPDWQNFLRCSLWCNDSLAKTAYVASRKAPMSFIYAKGKQFYPVYGVLLKDSLTNQSNPDSVLALFKEKGVTHIMIANLRGNPRVNDGQIINTMHNIAQPIFQKYPNKLKLVHTEGYSEQCFVFEITK